MNKKIKRQIPADRALNEQALDGIIDDLLGFPGWNGQRMDEWIDMVTLGLPTTHAIPHFRTVEDESFLIEITNSNAIITRPALMLRLLQQVAKVNRRSQERNGHSLLTLVFA